MVKCPPAMRKTCGLIPGSGRSPEEGNGNPLQYSCLENSMDGGAWCATVHGVTKSQTRPSDFTFFLSFEGVPRRDSGSCPVPSLLRLPRPDAGIGHSPGTLQGLSRVGPGLRSTCSTSGHLAWPSPHSPAILIAHIWLGSDDVAVERDVKAGL